MQSKTADIIAKYQEKLLQIEKMATLGRLTVGLCHEISNSLSIVYGLMQLSSLGGKEEDARRERDWVVVQNEAERMTTILNQLSSFARNGTADIKPLDVNVFVKKALFLVEREMEREGVKILKILYPDPLIISANGSQIMQVLLNIIYNARAAMSDGGVLAISTTLANKVKTPFVKVLVSDTGCGASEKTIRRLFDPVFTARLGNGNLWASLFASSQIIRGLGGTLAVKSKVGIGTTFTITLPVRK